MDGPARDGRSAARERAAARLWGGSARQPDERTALPELRELADRAFSRAAGAPLIPGNRVRLLSDATENYPRWLEAINAARRYVHVEMYFIQDDATGERFAEALCEKARQGVPVRVVYDWMGSLGRASASFWRTLRSAGVSVLDYNPPRLTSPFSWLSRDHRKALLVDDEVGFISGLCISSVWLGDAARDIAPWRDTGIEIQGPALAEMARAFARTWNLAGGALLDPPSVPEALGDTSMRIVSSEPGTAGMLRLDQLVAALARSRLWLTDAYYNGSASYVQALRAAAQDGVDVRLLVPNATDIPLIRPFSQAGYRTLLEAGVRVFEWNGTMLHAKTAVADGRWARVGSTNLNIASWLGNCELDAVIEDERFAAQMEQSYTEDLERSTEVVLDPRGRLRTPGKAPGARLAPPRPTKAARRASAGAIRIGHAIGAALTERRVLGPVEARLTTYGGFVLCAVSAFIALFPRAFAYPIALLGIWSGLSLLWRGSELRRQRRKARSAAARGE